MTMMSFHVYCDASEVWVLQNVCAQYKTLATVSLTDTPGTHVRLLVHAGTTAQGRHMQILLEGAQAALKALHFMGHVRVAETATPNAMTPSTPAKASPQTRQRAPSTRRAPGAPHT
jgi:hypothetical protein